MEQVKTDSGRSGKFSRGSWPMILALLGLVILMIIAKLVMGWIMS